jgi:hypothetical protein
MEPLKFNQVAASRHRSGENSTSSNSRRALILRCQLAVFSAYRIDQYAEPESFKTSLGAVLEQYPDEVITYVCDPRTGIQRRLKWPPTISEIVEACDEHAAFLERLRKQRPAFKERLPAPLLCDRPQGYLATIFVLEGHVRYEKLVEWTKEAKPMWWKFGISSDNRKGLWVSRFAWEGTPEIKF